MIPPVASSAQIIPTGRELNEEAPASPGVPPGGGEGLPDKRRGVGESSPGGAGEGKRTGTEAAAAGEDVGVDTDGRGEPGDAAPTSQMVGVDDGTGVGEATGGVRVAAGEGDECGIGQGV